LVFLVGDVFARLALTVLLVASTQGERITAIQVQGNTVTAEEEIVRLAGVQVGMPVEAATFEEAERRLRAARKFDHVEVLKRFASIADPSQVICVIVVDEGPVRVSPGGGVGPDGNVMPALVRKLRGPRLMFLPVIAFEDGYGFSYGLRTAISNPAGKDSLLSFPATWGGEKRAGIEFDKELQLPVLTRVKAGGALTRRKHPFFAANDDRRAVWARGERDIWRSLRAGASAGWDRVAFLGAHDRVARAGADLVVDTRIDPMLARNAVYARVAWDHLAFRASPDVNRTDLEARAYVGLPGQSVVVVRGLRQDASRSLPSYLRPMLGGTTSLRGLRAGTAIGDTLVAGSVELRYPLTSPLSVGKLGASGFVDVGTVYDKGQHLRDQSLERGVGGGVWFSTAFVRLNLYVAHALGGTTRVHFGTSTLF
jgi:outer membrane protein assembly factor BamA